MSLVTRCPACATTFRVLPAQLSARSGRVRCGKCTGVFDGVAHLLTEEAIAALPAEPSPQMGLFDPRDGRADPPEPAETPPAATAATAVEPPAELPAAQSPDETPGTDPEIEHHPFATEETTPVPTAAQPMPEFLVTVARPRTTYSLVWALLAAFSLAALAGQAVLHFRSEVAVLLPAARTYLETACDTLGCEVRLPHRADLMSIESSDLQADPKRKDVIVLNALLRNRAPFAQEFPDLELTLTDQADRAVIRRVLTPRDYLLQKSAIRSQGIAGGGEEVVRIHLATGNLPATGYQLFLFYPCPPVSASVFWQLGYPSRCQNSSNN